MKKNGISRRDFLKGAAAGMAALGLAGCTAAGTQTTAAPEGTKAPETTAAPKVEVNQSVPVESTPEYEVYHTELLIIGTGSAATWATQRALEAGKKIMMVDKGVFRHSGASAMSWDAWALWWDYAGVRHAGWQLINGETAYNAWQYLGEDFNPFVESINHGEVLANRGEDGMPIQEQEGLPWAVCSYFFRREMDDLANTGRIDVMDQVMVTDVIVNNGRCLGVVGLHLPTGKIRVIRADATVMACGGGTQFHGWHTIGYRGINSTDNTGDVQMGAFRRGIAIGEAEFAQYDFVSVIFDDVAWAFGTGIGADAGELELLYTNKKERMFSDAEIAEMLSGAGINNITMCQAAAKKIFEDGLGTELDGLYVKYDEDAFEKVRYPIMRNFYFFQERGFDPLKEFTQCAADMYEHGGEPVVDSKMMTEWEGLFDVRGASAVGENGGAHCMINRLYGHYTGHCAAEYLDSATPVNVDEIDWSGVIDECKRLQEIRTRKVENGLRPHEIRRKIQAAGYKGFTIYRSTQMMEEAIAELERIRKEDMPRQMLADDSTIYNTEWKAAIENWNLLDMAEVSIRASLMREETRGCYLRPEFPTRDDVNWNCLLAARYEDGKMTFEKRPYPAL